MRYPKAHSIRLKILVTLLLVVTAVVSIITFTMANLFHEDKREYIVDLTSLVALSAAEECRSILAGYGDRLEVYGRIMREPELTQEKKAELLQTFFEDFEDLIGVALYKDGDEVSAVFNTVVLEDAGISREALREYREKNPIPEALAHGELFVENATLSEALPALALSLTPSDPRAEHKWLVSAIIRLDTLLGVASRSAVFDVYLVDSKGILLADRNAARVARRQPADLLPEVEDLYSEYSAGVSLEFERDGRELVGGYARVGLGGVTAAAEVPKSAVYLASRALLNRLLITSLALLILAAVVSQMGSRGITRSLERLLAATRKIAKGQFDIQVRVNSRDEIGTLAGAFNQMATELRTRDEALEEAHRQLVQSEKMAAVGQLGAGIAHEVKNPLAGILGCAQLSLRKADKGSTLERNLQLIEKESKRCKTIVENLLKFARQEKAVLEPTDINSVVEDAIAIVSHQLELKQVKIKKNLADGLPQIHGNANQLQQVLMNLMMNAQQAMEGEPGAVMVSTRQLDEKHVEIAVSDTGPGIPEQIQQRIFDPFFTTKPGGKGTGLGLSVSFGIIQDHSGEIFVTSTPGEGATFTVHLPVLDEEAEREAEREADGAEAA